MTATDSRTAGLSDRKTFTEPELWALVGNTPMLSVRLSDRETVRLKCEWLNPGGSVKDRPALFILRDGLARGELPGKRLLDASSGNTAIAYAMLGAAAGIGVTVCVPANASRERRALLRAYGAEAIFTDPLEGADGAIRTARDLAGAHPGRYWYADQYNHPANPQAHYLTTADEIWRQTDGRITHLVAGVGTTGTLMGAGRRLKEWNPRVALIAVQPDGPFHGLEGLKHLATALVPGIYDPALPDRTEFVTTEEAEERVRVLARDAGLLVGWSTGAALVAAARLVRGLSDRPTVRPSDTVVVVVAPDAGTRYLSEAERLGGRGGEEEVP